MGFKEIFEMLLLLWWVLRNTFFLLWLWVLSEVVGFRKSLRCCCYHRGFEGHLLDVVAIVVGFTKKYNMFALAVGFK